MALYCTTCRAVVLDGDALCRVCNNGFISRLACQVCNRLTPQGTAICLPCSVSAAPPPQAPAAPIERHVELERPAPPHSSLPPHLQRQSGFALPPGLTLDRVVVPETRLDAGRFGAKAEVIMNGRDAEIMTKMNQVAMMLHALGTEMTGFQGIDGDTRAVIRGCRDLATRLQEEVERRRGPA